MRLKLAAVLIVCVIVIIGMAGLSTGTQPDGHIKSVSRFSWTQDRYPYSLSLNFIQGDWVQINVSCPSGPYLDTKVFPDCGAPEFLMGSEYVKVPCWNSTIPDPSPSGYHENFCGIVMPFSGKTQFYFPVLEYGVVYSGSAIVMQGAGLQN